MDDYARWKRQRWTEILCAYREQKHLTVPQLAEFLEKPKFSVRMWLRGRRVPHQKDLAVLCARLQVDYEAVFSRALAADLLFEERIIGFGTLQARYLEARERDAFAALSLVLIGACLAFSYVLKAGFQAKLENNTSFGSKICFLAAGLKSYVLAIQAQGEEGIGFLLLDQTLNIHLDWRPLNRMNLDALITFLVDRSAAVNHCDGPDPDAQAPSATGPNKATGGEGDFRAL